MNSSHLLSAALSHASMADNAAAVVTSFLSGKSKRTIHAYRQDLKDFQSFVNGKSTARAAEILLFNGHGRAHSLVLSYKASLMERQLQATTINRRLAALRSLVKFAKILGIIHWSLEVPNFKTQAYRDTRGPGASGFVCLLNEARKRKDKKGLRDTALLRTLYDLALRREELVRLDLADLDLNANTISILGKGQNQKMLLSLPEVTKTAILEWLGVRGLEPGPLFQGLDRAGRGYGRLTGAGLYLIIRDLGRRVGISTRPHGLRHAAITEACKIAQARGMPLEEVLDFSRHSNVGTLMIYRDRVKNVQGYLASLVASQTEDR